MAAVQEVVEVQDITNATEALHFQVRAISYEIQGVYSGREEFLTDKHMLKWCWMNVPRRLMSCGSRNHGFRARSETVLRRVFSKREKLVAKAADLVCNKPEVSEYNKKVEEVKGFAPCEKKGYAAVVDQLTSEHRTFRTTSRDSLIFVKSWLKIQAKFAERQELSLKKNSKVLTSGAADGFENKPSRCASASAVVCEVECPSLSERNEGRSRRTC